MGRNRSPKTGRALRLQGRRESQPEDRTLMMGVDVRIYVRASTDEQARSCVQQIADLEAEVRRLCSDPTIRLPREHCPEHGVYVDNGFSGWNLSPMERPGSQELLADCERDTHPRERPGIVLTWALSRFGRFKDGPEEAMFWIYGLRLKGWTYRSLTQPEIGRAGEDRLMAVIRACLEAEKDTASSEEKSAGVRRGKDDMMQRGIWTGGTAPFGYERWAVRIVEGRIEWLEALPDGKRNGNANSSTILKPGKMWDRARWIVTRYAYGDGGRAVSMEEIARTLNADRIPSNLAGRLVDGEPTSGLWHHTAVAKVLGNESYLAIQRDSEGVAHPALWEPLVPKEEWDAVQRRMSESRRRRRGVNSSYILSGLLHCATCREPLHGDVTDGVLYYKAKRGPAGAARCPGCRLRVRADRIEPIVLAAIPGIADHPVCLRQIESERKALRGGRSSVRDRIREIDDAIAELQVQVNRLVDLVRMGGAVGEVTGRQLEDLNAKIMRRRRERTEALALASGESPAAAHAGEVPLFEETYELASPEERKSLLQLMIVRVDLDHGSGSVRIAVRKPALMAA